MGVLCALCSVAGWAEKNRRWRDATIRRLESDGAYVWLDHTSGGGPRAAVDEIQHRYFDDASSCRLEGDRITEATLDVACQLRTLDEVEIFDTRLRPQAIARLGELPNLATLRLLRNAEVGRTGIADIVRACHRLETFECDVTGLKANGLDCLRQLPRLRVLTLASDVRIDSALDLDVLKRLPALEELRLEGLVLTASQWRDVGRIGSLRVLDARHTKLTDKPIVWAVNPAWELDCLLLDNAQIGRRGLEHLTRVRRIRRLSLDWCGGIDDSAMPVLTRIPGLKLVTIYDTDVTAAGIAVLTQSGIRDGFDAFQWLEGERE